MGIVSKNEIFGKTALLLTGVILVLVVYTSFFKSGNVSKIGVVEMDKLVYEFRGMKEATEDFTSKVNDWTTERDSLEKQLKFYLNQIRLDSLNNDTKKLNIDQQKFLMLRRSYMEFDESVKQKSQQQDQEMTIGVINQIKAYMKEYAENNGFDLVLTNTQMQSIGYVKSVNDITEEVLEYANERFEGKN